MDRDKPHATLGRNNFSASVQKKKKERVLELKRPKRECVNYFFKLIVIDANYISLCIPELENTKIMFPAKINSFLKYHNEIITFHDFSH